MRIHWPSSIKAKVGLISAAFLTALTLASCGGGGVAQTTTVSGALTVIPGTAELFPNVATTFTVSGGRAGYFVVSSNPTVLPAPGSFTGSQFTVVPNDVTATTPVILTIRDTLNATTTTTANVHIAVLNNLTTFTPIAPSGTGCGTNALCSGGDAQLTLTASQNGVKLTNRPIRFDVLQGQFQFVTPNSTVLVSSITVNTDETGLAVVTIRVPIATPTQVATLTMTDTTTGLVRYFNFNIIQSNSGVGILTTLPSGSTTFTGDKGPPGSTTGLCPIGGQVDYYIFGGTPPYSVVSPLPSLVFVSPGIVTTSGGRTTATINGCGASQLIVTDATQRVIETSQVIGVKGPAGDAIPPPVAPTTPVVTPNTLTLSACGQAGTISVTGTGTFTTTITTPNGSPGISVSPAGTITMPATVTVTRSSNPVPAPATPGMVSINFANSAGVATLMVTNSFGANCP